MLLTRHTIINERINIARQAWDARRTPPEQASIFTIVAQVLPDA